MLHSFRYQGRYAFLMLVAFSEIAFAQIPHEITLFRPLSVQQQNSIQQSIIQQSRQFQEYAEDCTFLSLEQSTVRLVREQKPERLTAAVALSDDSDVLLRLVRRNVFAPDAQSVITSSVGTTPFQPTLYATQYVGSIIGDGESLVSICFTPDEVFGMFIYHGTTYNIGKVQHQAVSHNVDAFGTDELTDMYALVSEPVQAKPSASARMLQCSVDEREMMQQSQNIVSILTQAAKGKEGASLQSDTRLTVEIAVDIDFATFQRFSNGERASAYAALLIATVSQIYERDVNVEIKISYLNVWTTQDPYVGNNTSAVLGSFISYWSNNRSTVRRNVAHLLSARDIGGGRAEFNALCGGFGVSGNLNVSEGITALPMYSRAVKVVAHELGHNFGSPHTHSCLWPGGAIDSCARAEDGYCFGATRESQGTIMGSCGQQTMTFHLLCRRLMRVNAEKAVCVGNEPTAMGKYEIRGTLRFEDNAPASRILLTLPNYRPSERRAVIDSVFTDANGNYRFTELATGHYTISVPSEFTLLGTQNSSSFSIILIDENISCNPVLKKKYSVVIPNTPPWYRFLVIGDSINGSVRYTASKDSTTLTLPNGTYSIIPVLTGYMFTPLIQQVRVSGAEVKIAEFAASSRAERFAIVGRIYNENNNGVNGFEVLLTGAATKRTVSDMNGAYIFNNLPKGEYSVRLAKQLPNVLTIFPVTFGANSVDAININLLVANSLLGMTSVAVKAIDDFQLYHYPNPSSDVVYVQYTLPMASQVRGELYSVLGTHVTTFIRTQQGAGAHTALIDVRTLASGIYYYRLTVEDRVITQKISVLR